MPVRLRRRRPRLRRLLRPPPPPLPDHVAPHALLPPLPPRLPPPRRVRARARPQQPPPPAARPPPRPRELSLSVALDRLPRSKAAAAEPPPVANSLMAAIKRSQASQRRQPESFNFYHRQPQQLTGGGSSVVKVELVILVVSILDDPLVSRVFGDVGFSSCDVKMATLGRCSNGGFHWSSFYTWQKNQNPSFNLCYLSGSDEKIESWSENQRFPFMGCFSWDENVTRISEVMLRDKKSNPLLLGVSSGDALRMFLKSLEKKSEGVVVVCVKDEILRFVNGGCDEGELKLRFEEVEKLLGDVVGKGVLVNLGDFEVLAKDGVDGLRYLVTKVGRLVKDNNGGKLRLIGAADNYEVYFNILNKFPSIEEEWDLEILPVTSLKYPIGSSCPRSRLMESFVPLGGFFSMPYDRIVQSFQPSKPSGFAAIKAKEDSLLLNAKIVYKEHTHQSGHQFPRVLGFQVAENKNENTSNITSSTDNNNVVSSLSTNFRDSSSSQGLHSLDTNSSSILSLSGQISPNSEMSVSTDLNLGVISSSTSPEPKKSIEDFIQDLSCSSSKYVDNDTHSKLKEPKMVHKALVERVYQQEEAICAVIEAITQGHIWINFQGPDKLGKKKLGLALAEILYGSVECFVFVDLSFSDEATHADKVYNSQVVNKYDLTMRGTVVDYLVEKLSENPRVVFLENVDKADHVVQNQLSRAVKTGRLADLRGREVNLKNSMFFATTNFSEASKCFVGGKELDKYAEEDVLKAKICSIQISVTFDLNDDPRAENLSDMVLMNKRKIVGQSKTTDRCGILEVTKKAHKASNSYLDLNFPADQTSEICKNCFEKFDSDSCSENSRSWPEEFVRQIDKVVFFKPLDFDTLAEELFKAMEECLHETVGSKCAFKIEFEVMKQILAAAYLFGNKNVEDWIKLVLRKGIQEAIGKFGLNARSIMKLVSCERILDEEQNEGYFLPGRIIVN